MCFSWCGLFSFSRPKVSMSRIKRRISICMTCVAAALFYAVVFFVVPRLVACDGNIQQHSREDESPSFQYTKEANEPYLNMASVDSLGKAWNWVYNGLCSGFSSLKIKNSGDLSVWSHALGSTVLISAAPFLILFFVPIDPSQEKQPTLKILLSFASGGLLGDSFLHLIPHALGTHHHRHADRDHDHSEVSHSHDGSHSHSHADGKCSGPDSAIAHAHGHVGLFVLLGIVAFLVIEKSVRLVNKAHNHSRSAENKKKEVAVKDSKDPKKGGSGKKQKKKEAISVAGYLNLAADFTHNLTDGLAIGASYLAGRNIGLLTTLTILLHEVPHEIGDFAILIRSGCSRRKAMILQLVTALGAVIGTFIALMVEGKGDIASTWILPFTAGGFIYISTVSILPELLEDSHFFQSLKEITAMLVGVLLMVLIADIE